MFDDGWSGGAEAGASPSSVSAPVAVASTAPRAAVLSGPVHQLLQAVEAVVAQVPVELPGSQALADTAALLGAVERLHAAVLGRVADVDARQLHALAGAPSTGTWVAQQQTSLDRGEVALARRLAGLPTLGAGVRDRRLSVAAAERVGKALAKLRRHVDRPDGLIDGQPAQEVLLGVIGHGVRGLVCQALGGLADDDPRLGRLLHDLSGIVTAPSSELTRLEAAFVLLAEHLEPALLPGALATLVDACLPNELEKRAADTRANRGFGIRPNADGSGWHVTDGDLDLGTTRRTPRRSATCASTAGRAVTRCPAPVAAAHGPGGSGVTTRCATGCDGCSTAGRSARGTRSRPTWVPRSGSTCCTAHPVRHRRWATRACGSRPASCGAGGAKAPSPGSCSAWGTR